MPPARLRRRRMLFAALLVLALGVVAEALAHVAMAVLGTDPRFDFTPVRERRLEMQAGVRKLLDDERDTLLRLDPEIGWVYGPDHRGELYSSNGRGLRGRRDYAPSPPPGVLRIAAFGDSFVHANEVADDASWPARLEAMAPGIEVPNYGVGGYGTDQALLYYARRGEELEPHVAVLGFVEVDYARNLNRFRGFRSPHGTPLFKPRFVLSADPGASLELLPNPFPGRDSLRVLLDHPSAVERAADRDWFHQPLVWSNPLYDRVGLVRLLSSVASDAWRARLRPDGLYRGGRFNPDSEAFALLVALIERFADLARERNQAFVLVVFPSSDQDIWGDAAPAYQPLLDRIGDAHTVLDLAAPLRADPRVTPETIWRPGRHYGPEANDAVARALHDLVRASGWAEAPDRARPR